MTARGGELDRRSGREAALALRIDLPYLLVIALALAGFFALRATQRFEFPTPWPDEGSFLWQAINFGEHGTLFAPELNPTRHVFWMPPGYMVITGVIFSVTGFSLGLARLLSGVFIAAAMLCVSYMLRRSRLRLAHAALLGLFMVSPIVQLAANTARMEPLVLLTATAAFALMSRGALLGGVSIACLTPLMHPNGVFPAAGAILLFFTMRIVDRKWPNWGHRELWAAGVLIVSWVSYGIYVGLHAEHWLADIRNQLNWKQTESTLTGGLFERVTQVETVLLSLFWIAAVAVTVLRARGRARDATAIPGDLDVRSMSALLALAGSFVLQTLLTVGWMYELYGAFAYALLACITLELVGAVAWPLRRGMRAAIVSTAILVGIVFAFIAPRRPFLMRSVTSATVFHEDAPRYLQDEDIEVVRKALVQLTSWHGPLRIQFLPEADALLFADLRSDRIRFLQQTRYEGVPDMYVYHDSVWIPEFVRKMNVLRMGFQQGVPIPVPKWPIIHQRDGTEEWRVYRRK